jgi:hypothetical protein
MEGTVANTTVITSSQLPPSSVSNKASMEKLRCDQPHSNPESQTASPLPSCSSSPSPSRPKKVRRGQRKKPQQSAPSQANSDELEALRKKLEETELALERSQQLVKVQTARLAKLARKKGDSFQLLLFRFERLRLIQA